MSGFPVDEAFGERPAAALIELLAEPLEEAWSVLRQQTCSLGAPFDEEAQRALFANLPNDLLWMLERVGVCELERAGRRAELVGDSPEARYDHFAARLQRSQTQALVWTRHPLLHERLLQRVRLVLVACRELAIRLAADWQRLCGQGAVSVDSRLIEVRMWRDGSRAHARSSTLLRFDDGRRLSYSPWPVQVEQQLARLYQWLETAGASWPSPHLKSWCATHYGWVEDLPPADCATDAEVTRFHLRQGRNLALLYLLRAAGASQRTIVAAGDRPLIVGSIELLTPRIEHDLLNVGLLPCGESIDLSALGSAAGAASLPPPALVDVRTDRMRFARPAVRWAEGANRAHLAGVAVDARAHVGACCAGFSETWQILQTRKDDVARLLAPFAEAEITVHLHRWAAYSGLLLGSTHPTLSADSEAREQFYERLYALSKNAAARAAIRAAIERGDAPRFTATAQDNTLFADGISIGVLPGEPLQRAVLRRLHDLDDDGRLRCLEIVQQSLSSVPAIGAQELS